MASPVSSASAEIEFADVDLHFARAVTRITQSTGPEVAAAAALASRATGNGDVCVRLSEYAGQPIPGFGLTGPTLSAWTQSLRDSAAVGGPGEFRPLVLDESGRLYLYRYWSYEKRLAEDLLARAVDAEDVDEPLLKAGLQKYFGSARESEQRVAAATAVLRRFCVISGGPGTGKTTTVVKILALLAEQARGQKLAVAVAAPTGKAAARVQDALRAAIERLDLDLLTRPSVPTDASTIHRLLGARPDSVYYRYHRSHPLALDVLVIDEASMADLALAAKLVEALPPRSRLILLGDKDQLASVEAGAVLGDICRSTGYSTPFAKRLAHVTQVPARSIATSGGTVQPLADSVALLSTSYRFGPETGIGKLARLVNSGEGSAALALLQSGDHTDLAWRTVAPRDLRARLAESVAEGLRPFCEAVRDGDNAQEIFERFHSFRVLCAHRRGLFGVSALNRMIEEMLDQHGLVSARDTWYPGRPVMVTRNDHNLRLFNGDIGIVLRDANAADALRVFLPGADGGMRSIAPARLPEHETVFAMTIHKAQGSEFGRVLMILPDELTPIMTRELVYTGITRASSAVEIWGSEPVFRDAVGRRLVRDSALHERLWRP